MKINKTVSVCLLFIVSLGAVVDARVFTAIDGRTLEGTILSLRDGKVQMQRAADGRQFALPLERFSVKDQNFLKAEVAAGRLTADGYTGTVKAVTPVKKNPLHLNASRRIDLILEQYWAARGIEPVPLVSDERYVRRAYLSLVGRIPTAAEAIHFFNRSEPNKRSLLVDKLLNKSNSFLGLRYFIKIECQLGKRCKDWILVGG